MIISQFEGILRILLSALLGGFIGYERHSRSKEAGVRTHAIVALAAALMMLISKYGFSDTPGSDPARMASQVIPGIGFLGAGIIFIRKDTIQGLTTAAGIWATAGIGLAIGAGMYPAGIFSAILIVLIESVLHRSFYFGGMRISLQLELEVEKRTYTEKTILKILEQHRLTPDDMKYANGKSNHTWFIIIDAATQTEFDPDELLASLRKCEGVIRADIKNACAETK